jgi:hypothetical protein
MEVSQDDTTVSRENTGHLMSIVPVPIEPSLLLVRSSATVSREIAGETIVVPICAGVGDMEAVYTFNEVGGNLWKLLKERRAIGDLVDWVVRNFDVTSEAAAADVQGFLEELRGHGLVETVGLDLQETKTRQVSDTANSGR